MSTSFDEFSGYSLMPLLFLLKEAYEEFKHVLLAFIYDKDDQSSPVADEVGCFNYCICFQYH